jgi:hypothetical protein
MALIAEEPESTDILQIGTEILLVLAVAGSEFCECMMAGNVHLLVLPLLYHAHPFVSRNAMNILNALAMDSPASLAALISLKVPSCLYQIATSESCSEVVLNAFTVYANCYIKAEEKDEEQMREMIAKVYRLIEQDAVTETMYKLYFYHFLCDLHEHSRHQVFFREQGVSLSSARLLDDALHNLQYEKRLALCSLKYLNAAFLHDPKAAETLLSSTPILNIVEGFLEHGDEKTRRLAGNLLVVILASASMELVLVKHSLVETVVKLLARVDNELKLTILEAFLKILKALPVRAAKWVFLRTGILRQCAAMLGSSRNFKVLITCIELVTAIGAKCENANEVFLIMEKEGRQALRKLRQSEAFREESQLFLDMFE